MAAPHAPLTRAAPDADIVTCVRLRPLDEARDEEESDEVLVARLCNKECGSFQNGRHVINAVGGHGPGRKGQGSGSDKRDRYKIPASLIHELLSLAILNAAV